AWPMLCYRAASKRRLRGLSLNTRYGQFGRSSTRTWHRRIRPTNGGTRCRGSDSSTHGGLARPVRELRSESVGLGHQNHTSRRDPAPVALVLVAAVAENGVIGRDSGMPWRLRSDLRRFRARTWGKPVVMGRKTFLSLGKPLPGRTNIVVSRDAGFSASGAIVARNLRAALDVARGDVLRRGAEAIVVIGGAEIYAQTLPIADRLDITLVKTRPEGNVRFPPIDPQVWREIERNEQLAGPGDSADVVFITYGRSAGKADRI